MNGFSLLNPFPLGIVIGVLGSILGAGIDLLISRRSQRTYSTGGFLLLIAGGFNTLVGAVAILISILVTGSIRTALIIGLGVLTGFVIGFLTIAIFWILVGRYDVPPDRQK